MGFLFLKSIPLCIGYGGVFSPKLSAEDMQATHISTPFCLNLDLSAGQLLVGFKLLGHFNSFCCFNADRGSNTHCG